MEKRKKIKHAEIIGLIAAACLVPELFSATEYDIVGRIESLRKDNTITVLFNKKPAEDMYYIVKDGTVYGQAEIITIEFIRSGIQRYRAVASVRLRNRMYSKLIRAGEDIGLVKSPRMLESVQHALPLVKEKEYRLKIVAGDNKEMVLIPAGRFIFGSNNGDKDESPEQVVNLENYYIDKYEVSNREYKIFIDSTNIKPTLSWEGGTYAEGEADLPVLVTYYEALAYAQWAGKRLPTEEEWEKAARGTGKLSHDSAEMTYIYPWGKTFDPEKLNCSDFWSSGKIGAHIKSRFNITVKGLMPITSFDPEGVSPYGVVNMAGNAKEWTSSWYMPYKGNSSKKGSEYKRYGRQFKVVRGGAWYNPGYRVRATSREVGGIPNLYSDNLPGFRCVRDATALDLLE